MEISTHQVSTQSAQSPFKEGSLRLLLQKYTPLAQGFPVNPETHQAMGGDQLINMVFDDEHLLGRGDLTIVLRGTLASGQGNGAETRVAVKVFYPKLDLVQTPEDRDILRKQFDDEVELLRQSNHPNIGRFLGFYEIRLGNAKSKFPALAHEYFPTTLAELIQSDKVFSQDETLSLVTQIADATNYLYQWHQRVFLDITSANIGVREDGSFALMDINLAVPDGEVLRPGNQYNFSEDILPPEMIDLTHEVTANPRLAVYNLGVLVYELFGGSRSTREEKMSGSVDLPQLPALSFQLNEVLRKATTNKIEDRYDTIVEFMSALASVSGRSSAETIL